MKKHFEKMYGRKTKFIQNGVNISKIRDKEVVFRKSNIKELRSKLDWLIANPDVVDRYKEEAADFISCKCNWNDVVEKTIENVQRID